MKNTFYFIRRNHHRCSIKIGALKNFAKFSEKHLWQNLFFNKVAGLRIHQSKYGRPATLLKKRIWHRCFPANFAKFLWTPFFIEHLWTTAFLCVWMVIRLSETVSYAQIIGVRYWKNSVFSLDLQTFNATKIKHW